MNGAEDNHIQQEEPRPPRRRLPGYDALWKRISALIGVSLGCAEWYVAQRVGRPLDLNAIALVGMFIGGPLLVGGPPRKE